MTRFCLVLLAASSLLGADAPPQLTYTRTFPGSIPPYFRISVAPSGAFEYSEAPKDPQPLRAQMQASEASALFDLANKLNDFKTPLESGLKVANTGKKVFQYRDGNGSISETTFNYSTNPTAQQLLEKFEEIASSERAYFDLDRTVHFDKLGVNDALAEIEALWLNKKLAAPEQFVPLLTRVATHESFMHLARDRAARLKDEFGKPVAAVVGNSGPQ